MFRIWKFKAKFSDCLKSLGYYLPPVAKEEMALALFNVITT